MLGTLITRTQDEERAQSETSFRHARVKCCVQRFSYVPGTQAGGSTQIIWHYSRTKKLVRNDFNYVPRPRWQLS